MIILSLCYSPPPIAICLNCCFLTLSTDMVFDMLPSDVETTQSSEMSRTDSNTEKGQHGRSHGLPLQKTSMFNEAQTAVPLLLNNFISCIVGATKEPALDNFVNISMT